MFILVKGTTILSWGENPIESDEDDQVLFEIDDGGWIEEQDPSAELHWDGSRFWVEEPKITVDDLAAALVELASMIGGA